MRPSLLLFLICLAMHSFGLDLCYRRSLSASQLAHLQDFISPQQTTRMHGSGTIFASQSPRMGHSHPTLALTSPTNALASAIEQGFASRADSASADSFATPSSSLLASPITLPNRTGSLASDAAVSGGWAQRPANRLSTSPSNAGKIFALHVCPVDCCLLYTACCLQHAVKRLQLHMRMRAAIDQILSC